MICAVCRRTISKKELQAKHYVYSRFTGDHYCLRPDCESVGKRLKRKLVAV